MLPDALRGFLDLLGLGDIRFGAPALLHVALKDRHGFGYEVPVEGLLGSEVSKDDWFGLGASVAALLVVPTDMHALALLLRPNAHDPQAVFRSATYLLKAALYLPVMANGVEDPLMAPFPGSPDVRLPKWPRTPHDRAGSGWSTLSLKSPRYAASSHLAPRRSRRTAPKLDGVSAKPKRSWE